MWDRGLGGGSCSADGEVEGAHVCSCQVTALLLRVGLLIRQPDLQLSLRLFMQLLERVINSFCTSAVQMSTDQAAESEGGCDVAPAFPKALPDAELQKRERFPTASCPSRHVHHSLTGWELCKPRSDSPRKIVVKQKPGKTHLYSLTCVCCSALLLLRSLGTRQPSGERTATWAMHTSSSGGSISLLSTTSKYQGLRQTQGTHCLEILTYCSGCVGSGGCDRGPRGQLFV